MYSMHAKEAFQSVSCNRRGRWETKEKESTLTNNVKNEKNGIQYFYTYKTDKRKNEIPYLYAYQDRQVKEKDSISLYIHYKKKIDKWKTEIQYIVIHTIKPKLSTDKWKSRIQYFYTYYHTPVRFVRKSLQQFLMLLKKVKVHETDTKL